MAEQNFPDDYLKYDKSNYKKSLDGFTNDIKKGYNQEFRNIVSDIKKTQGMRVIHCGMGGSGIAADLMQAYLEDEQVLIESIKDYKIPGELRNTDLVIISSYSGNTEEMLSCYRQVRRVGAQLIILTSGGKLGDAAVSGRVPLVKLPAGYQPRAILGYHFFTLLKVLEEIGIVGLKRDEVQETVDTLFKQSFQDFGINLSEKIYGKIPMIYASNRYYPVAYRWKTQINENSKELAFSNKFSELNHNETAGFDNKNGIFYVVMITTDSDSSRVKKRMKIQKDLLQKQGVDVTELHVRGSPLTAIFTAIIAGDLTSYYLALRNNVDPEPVEKIEAFKKQLGPFI